MTHRKHGWKDNFICMYIQLKFITNGLERLKIAVLTKVGTSKSHMSVQIE